MIRFASLGLVSLITVAGPVLAQQTPNPPSPQAATTSSKPAGAPTNPNLAVATVTSQGGARVSKLIGSAVYNDQNARVGSIDDLIVKDGNRIVIAVVSLGGFLGIGNRLVAVPFDKMHIETNNDDRKIILPGATKDTMSALPTFTYGG